MATISGAGIATNQHTVRHPIYWVLRAEDFCFLTSCLQQPKMCVGCFVLLRPGHFGLSQAQKADGNLEERDPGCIFSISFNLKICLIPSSISAIFCRAVMAGHRVPPWNRSNLLEGSAEVSLTQFILAWCGSRFQLDSIIAK